MVVLFAIKTFCFLLGVFTVVFGGQRPVGRKSRMAEFGSLGSSGGGLDDGVCNSDIVFCGSGDDGGNGGGDGAKKIGDDIFSIYNRAVVVAGTFWFICKNAVGAVAGFVYK